MEELLKRTVRLRGLKVGHVVDVIVDSANDDVVGVEVRCEDGKHRFLPMAAASLVGDEIVIDSPFSLLEEDELEFYRERGMMLRGRRKPAA
jgi:PRC-barrel domain